MDANFNVHLLPHWACYLKIPRPWSQGVRSNRFTPEPEKLHMDRVRTGTSTMALVDAIPTGLPSGPSRGLEQEVGQVRSRLECGQSSPAIQAKVASKIRLGVEWEQRYLVSPLRQLKNCKRVALVIT